MIKLPLLLSVFKKYNDVQLYLLDSKIDFECAKEYNSHINYKIYDVIQKKEKSYIRSHIKQLQGVHSNDLVKLNKKLEEENKILIKKNDNIMNKIEQYKNEIVEIKKLKEIIQEKNICLEENYEKKCNENNIIKKKYIEKLCIINSNINEIIIDEKKKLFE
jgi:predicted nuclease with TOPRIM domain